VGCFVLSVNYQATFEFAETELKIGNRILVDLWLVYGKAKKITYRQKYADLEKYKETYEKTGHKVEIYRSGLMQLVDNNPNSTDASQ